MRAALKLAPLRRPLPLPGKLGALADLAPPWANDERPPEVTPAQGTRRGRVGLLTGCVQSVVFGDVNAAGCGSTLKETGHLVGAEGFAARFREATELLAEPQATRHPLPLGV